MKKILLIDDNNQLLENTAEILELAGYKVFKANNGKVGVEIAFREIPDMILCDITMPLLDGYGVLHVLQNSDSTKNIPFVFLTARSEKSEVRKGMSIGADDYLTKPFSGIDLLDTIESRLRKITTLKEAVKNETKAAAKSDAQFAGDIVLKEFLTNGTTNKFKKKQVVYTEGNRPNCLFFVKKGKVKTFKTSSDGREMVINLYNDGDFIGYVPLVDNSNYKETAEAIEDTELAIIPREEFDKLVNNDIGIGKRFMKMLAKNVSEKEDQLVGIAYNSLRKKVAEALMTVYNKYNRQLDKHFTIDMSRESLAGIAATAKESFIRTLGDFKNEKLVAVDEGIITILEPTKLTKLAN